MGLNLVIKISASLTNWRITGSRGPLWTHNRIVHVLLYKCIERVHL